MRILYSLVVLIAAEENGDITLNKKPETLWDSCALRKEDCGCDCTREYKTKEITDGSATSNTIILQCEYRMSQKQLETIRLDLLEQ